MPSEGSFPSSTSEKPTVLDPLLPKSGPGEDQILIDGNPLRGAHRRRA